jgi:hypothetical protein
MLFSPALIRVHWRSFAVSYCKVLDLAGRTSWRLKAGLLASAGSLEDHGTYWVLLKTAKELASVGASGKYQL